MSKPNQQEVNDLLICNPANGKLYWKERDIKYFPDTRSCNSWNTRYAGKEAFTSVRNTGYKHGNIFGKNYQAHHIIWLMCYGYWPTCLDHINGNRVDNRIENLREADKVSNGRNMKISKSNSSGKIGVSRYGNNGKYRVRINANSGTIHIGCFDTYEDAVLARELAENQQGYHENHGRKE